MSAFTQPVSYSILSILPYDLFHYIFAEWIGDTKTLVALDTAILNKSLRKWCFTQALEISAQFNITRLSNLSQLFAWLQRRNVFPTNLSIIFPTSTNPLKMDEILQESLSFEKCFVSMLKLKLSAEKHAVLYLKNFIAMFPKVTTFEAKNLIFADDSEDSGTIEINGNYPWNLTELILQQCSLHVMEIMKMMQQMTSLKRIHLPNTRLHIPPDTKDLLCNTSLVSAAKLDSLLLTMSDSTVLLCLLRCCQSITELSLDCISGDREEAATRIPFLDKEIVRIREHLSTLIVCGRANNFTDSFLRHCTTVHCLDWTVNTMLNDEWCSYIATNYTHLTKLRVHHNNFSNTTEEGIRTLFTHGIYHHQLTELDLMLGEMKSFDHCSIGAFLSQVFHTPYTSLTTLKLDITAETQFSTWKLYQSLAHIAAHTFPKVHTFMLCNKIEHLYSYDATTEEGRQFIAEDGQYTFPHLPQLRVCYWEDVVMLPTLLRSLLTQSKELETLVMRMGAQTARTHHQSHEKHPFEEFSLEVEAYASTVSSIAWSEAQNLRHIGLDGYFISKPFITELIHCCNDVLTTVEFTNYHAKYFPRDDLRVLQEENAKKVLIIDGVENSTVFSKKQSIYGNSNEFNFATASDDEDDSD